ncbi:hypothetical protein V8G54_027098 [Vigna mungo]|uniref:EF-hand domain-containing protein n=1 Tax=Vigna mungo TaxID=3915 RepID=A0AAQ3RMR2_VIGMU
MRNISKTPYSVFVLLLATTIRVQGRYLTELVSDGVHKVQHKETSYLVLKGIDDESCEEHCKQMYGFLPCTDNIFGHLFLILVYEYLLFHGESYLAKGGEQIFKILGPGIFGASAFHILAALPESLILLVSGLVSNREIAEEYGMTGIGLLAGSSILLLTVVWGSCVIVGRQQFQHYSSASNSHHKTVKAFFTEKKTGICETRSFNIENITRCSEEHPAKDLHKEWDSKCECHKVRFRRTSTLNESLTCDKLFIGTTLCRRLYREIDQDGSSGISASEVRDLLLKNKVTETNFDEDKEVEQVLQIFDLDGDKRISKEEFVSGFTKWLRQTQHALEKQYFSRKSLKNIFQVFGPWIETKRKEREGKKQLICEILKHVQSDVVGSLLTVDGKPDEQAIRGLFVKIDRNRDNFISQSELRDLIMNIKFVKASMEVEEAVALVIEELDINNDSIINEEEFVSGFQKWLSSTSAPAPVSHSESQEDMYQSWEEVDMVVEEKRSEAVVDKTTWAWFKAISYVVLGIAMLSILAEPLTESVHNFSNSVGLHPFFMSFILVPLATNAREATSAIKEASHKKPRTTSLAISEIYGGVLMNNILGFFAISVLICVGQVTWQYSAELLVVAIVCSIAGLTASFRSTFPLWSSFFAILLYPLSLVLVFVLDQVLHYK